MCDVEPWKQNPLNRWIYIKSNLCDVQSIKWYPCPVEPNYEDFPVIIRPLINLSGMGSEVVIANTVKEYRDLCCYGYFATPFITGEHTSHDFHVVNGVVQNETIFKGYKNNEHDFVGTFLYWELVSLNCKPKITENLRLLLSKMKNYSGPLNIECIDNKIIEAHLRTGDIDVIEPIEKPLYLVPIWGSIYDDDILQVEKILKQPGVLKVIKDTDSLPKTGSILQRKALVITKELPEELKQSSTD
tara:strand:- start:794 stop:1525 length:732 start_codon:yes stop_codon:yes gene_type:complete